MCPHSPYGVTPCVEWRTGTCLQEGDLIVILSSSLHDYTTPNLQLYCSSALENIRDTSQMQLQKEPNTKPIGMDAVF